MTKLFGPMWLDRGEFPGEPHLPNVVVVDSSNPIADPYWQATVIFGSPWRFNRHVADFFVAFVW